MVFAQDTARPLKDQPVFDDGIAAFPAASNIGNM
jgi:hypothetical protein